MYVCMYTGNSNKNKNNNKHQARVIALWLLSFTLATTNKPRVYRLSSDTMTRWQDDDNLNKPNTTNQTKQTKTRQWQYMHHCDVITHILASLRACFDRVSHCVIVLKSLSWKLLSDARSNNAVMFAMFVMSVSQSVSQSVSLFVYCLLTGWADWLWLPGWRGGFPVSFWLQHRKQRKHNHQLFQYRCNLWEKQHLTHFLCSPNQKNIKLWLALRNSNRVIARQTLTFC